MATTSITRTRMSTTPPMTPPMTPPAMAPAPIVKLGQENDNYGKSMPVHGHTLALVNISPRV